MENMEKSDLPNGELTMMRPSTEPMAGPFTGIAYCTPAWSYHWAFVMASSTMLAPKRACTEVNVFLFVYPNIPRMLWLKYGSRFGFPSEMLRGFELSGTGSSCEVEGWAERPK